MTQKTLLIFGYGYVAKFLAQSLSQMGWRIYSTSRTQYTNIDAHTTLVDFFSTDMPHIIAQADMIISTIPPDETGSDPVLATYQHNIVDSQCQWIGYLSSTSVYGNHDGAWVDENTLCKPSNLHAKQRLQIEQAWLSLYTSYRLHIHIFRLSGIYGPEKNYKTRISRGQQYVIVKPGQYFSRIHVEDIVLALSASMQHPTSGEVFNISDSMPAPPQAVAHYAAALLHQPKLEEVTYGNIALPQRLDNFYCDNKKVCSAKIVERLTLQWKYPSYKEGLAKGC